MTTTPTKHAGHRFGARARAAAVALRELQQAPDSRVSELVTTVVAGGLDREPLLQRLLAAPRETAVAAACASALGEPTDYSLSERSRIAAWLAASGGSPGAWSADLESFPLPESRPIATLLQSRLSTEASPLSSCVFPGGTETPAERFARARLAVVSRPAEADAVATLRDHAVEQGGHKTLAALFDTGWLDASVEHEATHRALLSIPWSTEGASVVAFAARTAYVRDALLARGGRAAQVAGLMALACADHAAAHRELRGFLPEMAHPFLLASAALGDRPDRTALEAVSQRDRFELLFELGAMTASTRPTLLLDRLDLVGLPDMRDPLFDALALAFARAFERGRPSGPERRRFEAVFAALPAWRRRLPASDRIWLATAETMSRSTDAEAIASALQTSLLAEPSATWAVAVIDRLLNAPLRDWLADEWGFPTPFGALAHAVLSRALAGLDRGSLAPADRDDLSGLDVAAALAAGRRVLARTF